MIRLEDWQPPVPHGTTWLHRLEHLVVLGADELAICRGCCEAAAHLGRLSHGHPILFDLERLP